MIDKKIRRWNNICSDRRELVSALNKTKKYPLATTASTGFAVVQLDNSQQQQQAQKSIASNPINEREESPVSASNDPVFDRLPPKKPPRTFKTENKTERKLQTNDQKVPTSLDSNSSSFDLGMNTCPLYSFRNYQ